MTTPNKWRWPLPFSKIRRIFIAAWSEHFLRAIFIEPIRSVITYFKMSSPRSGLTMHTIDSEQIKQPSEQFLDNSMTGVRFSNETSGTRSEAADKPLTHDTVDEQGDAKPPDKQAEYGLTVLASMTELPGSTSTFAACVAVTAASNSQESDSSLEKSTDISTESESPFLGEPNDEAAPDSDRQIGISLDKGLVEDITPAATSTSNDTSFGDGSQVPPDADHWSLVPDCHAESRDKIACDSKSSQSLLGTGVQVAKPIESDKSKPGEVLPPVTGKDIGSVIVIMDDDAEQTTKTRRNSPRNSAKRSFKDFARNGNPWGRQILEDLDEFMELTDDVLEKSKNIVKRAKIIRNQLIESQKYIRDCGGEAMTITDRLEKL